MHLSWQWGFGIYCRGGVVPIHCGHVFLRHTFGFNSFNGGGSGVPSLETQFLAAKRALTSRAASCPLWIFEVPWCLQLSRSKPFPWSK